MATSEDLLHIRELLRRVACRPVFVQATTENAESDSADAHFWRHLWAQFYVLVLDSPLPENRYVTAQLVMLGSGERWPRRLARHLVRAQYD